MVVIKAGADSVTFRKKERLKERKTKREKDKKRERQKERKTKRKKGEKERKTKTPNDMVVGGLIKAAADSVPVSDLLTNHSVS